MDIIPTVYCVVPVYNRLETTKSFLQHIEKQDYPAVYLIIVDDGSTDGTGEYLARTPQSNLTVLKGDGNLWWGGAMYLGVSWIMRIAKQGDYLLMINNDVRIEKNYISTLVKESVTNGAAVVGSMQRDDMSGALLGRGWHIDYWAMRFNWINCEDRNIAVNALSGRGVLFPMGAVFQVGNVNARFFPHYLCDIEYTTRVSEAGWKILVSKAADVFTSAQLSDAHIQDKSLFSKYGSFRSRKNLLHKILFFSLHGPLFLRILAAPRYPLTIIARFFEQFCG